MLSKAIAAGKGSELLKEAINLYVQIRIEGTNIERDGDMLLFQWVPMTGAGGGTSK